MSEVAEQIGVVAWARANANRPGYEPLRWLLHIPNGGKRTPREAATLRKMGVLKGAPDLFLAYPSGPYHGLFIELKTAKGRVSPEQQTFLNWANGNGYLAAVAIGKAAAIRALEEYLDGHPDPSGGQA